MSLFKTLKISLLFITMGIFLISCSTIPKKEISEAELAIKESEKINANKYAPTQLNNAKTDLEEAKKLVVEEKNDEAKNKAITAKDKGWQAYFLSIAEFSKNENESTTKSMNEAKASYADKLVPDKYNQAKGLYDEVQQELEQLKQLEAKLKKLEEK